jgi:Tol biopolymer transport system component
MTRRWLLLVAAVCAAVTAAAVLAPPTRATFPARNGRIVFAADITGSSQLYVVRPDGHGLRQITHLDGDAVHPDWGPGGRRIVFEWDLPNDGGTALAMVNADGSHLHQLAHRRSDVFDGQPSFTPDGRHIVFERYNPAAHGGKGDDAIFERTISGDKVWRLTEPYPNGQTDPNVSPDGRRVSVVQFRNGVDFQQALVTSDLRGGHVHRLTPYSFDVGVKQDWSPSGRRLTFTRTANPGPDTGETDANLATIGADGRGLRMLTNFRHGVMNAFAGSYSPDGRWIVYRLENQITQRFALWKIHPNGSGARPILLMGELRPRFVDWGPSPR